jgi:heparan-alpha-glucosaminide N-acetyltransferase
VKLNVTTTFQNLWSISFVLVTTCFAFLLLSCLYVIVDAKQYWKGQPWFYAGG